jgi:hypothetical protein
MDLGRGFFLPLSFHLRQYYHRRMWPTLAKHVHDFDTCVTVYSMANIEVHPTAFMKYGYDKFVAEASDLGLAPGVYPATITMNGTTYSGRAVARDPEGDVTHVEYYAFVQGFKRTLVIYND